jgi:hypothetical protein
MKIAEPFHTREGMAFVMLEHLVGALPHSIDALSTAPKLPSIPGPMFCCLHVT